MSRSSGGLVGAFARRGLFYGWVVVAVGFVMQMITATSIQGLSTYVVPFEREFGWSRVTIGFGRSFQQLDTAFGPINGALADRIGPRRMVVIGVGLYGLALTLFSRIDSLWSYYGASALMAVANAFCGLLVVSVAVNHWFRRKRTTALGLAFLGVAIGGATVVPLVVLAQSAFGWRQAALLTALGILLVGVPAALFMRDSPEAHGLLPDGEAHGPEASAGAASRALAAFTLREALRTRAFWLLTAAHASAMASHGAVLVYQFAHVEGVLSREAATAALVALNLFNIVGRVAGGYLGDRLQKHSLLALAVAGQMVSLVILGLADTFLAFIVFGAFFGLCWGVRTPVAGSIPADYFGRRSYGRIAGTIQTIALPAAIAGPVLAGLIADAQHDYRPAFLALAATSALSSVLYAFASGPRKPAQSVP